MAVAVQRNLVKPLSASQLGREQESSTQAPLKIVYHHRTRGDGAEGAASGTTRFGILLGLRLAGYGCALMYQLPAMRSVHSVYLAHYFLRTSIAVAMSILLLASGRTIGTWKPQR